MAGPRVARHLVTYQNYTMIMVIWRIDFADDRNY